MPTTPTPESAPDEGASEESYRVNIPASDAPGMADAPDSGYALVRYSKDGDAFCLDLGSIKLSSEAPSEPDADDEGDYDNLKEALGKQMKKSLLSTDDGSGDEG